MSSGPPPASVYLNPRFKNIHINPKFIKPPAEEQRPKKILVNPNFIKKTLPVAVTPTIHVPSAKPILCTRNKLIRNVNPREVKPISVTPAPSSTLKKIGLRKLIRKTTNIPGSSPVTIARNRGSAFKLDRRTNPSALDNRPKVVSSRYRLKRASFSDVLTPKKIISSKYRLRRIGTVPKSPIKDPSTKLCAINGVLYKSLTKNEAPSTSKVNSRGNALYIRGERFLVTGNGNSLKRVAPSSATTSSSSATEIPVPRRRIDVGGLTYVANDQGTFERTNSHLVRSYLNQAKQKSLNILAAGKFRKTNVPCAIYRRLGKCRANERGKCNKLHNPDQITVCPKFLKGLCTNSECLLSHKVCLTKMPVCRFFLDGCCTMADCPYLHKKVNDAAEICVDFQRGFCPLAEKCSKRHEREKIPRTKRSITKFKSKPNRDVQLVIPESMEQEESRYYKNEPVDSEKKEIDSKADENGEDDSNSDTESIVPKRRPPIGSLPAFIPL